MAHNIEDLHPSLRNDSEFMGRRLSYEKDSEIKEDNERRKNRKEYKLGEMRKGAHLAYKEIQGTIKERRIEYEKIFPIPEKYIGPTCSS